MSLPVVLAQGGRGWRAELPVEGGWPRPASLATVSPALEAALRANAQQAAQALPAAATPAPAGALAAALLGALLGGLVLNLMPCVFPVLAIKVAGFARHGQDRRAHRLGGIAYTAGVVLSFLALGGAMLALRAAGEAVGWGFQLQSPAVVAVLAALFTLIGLNLSGMFEFGRMLPSSLAGLQARHPAADAFLTGVLAVAVASPCTAPFMGASVGLTATLPAAQALAVFAALGVGLALPYLAASWVPAVARALPRPGAWMDTLRRFLAFPMFATVVWLVWVLGQQSGIDGAAALLALLVALGMVVWAFTLAGRARMAMAPLSLVVFAALAMAAVPKITEMAPPAMAFAAPGTSGAAGTAPNAAAWQAWRPGLAEELLAQGRPVFVDYTAAWCVTCQFNKKTTLSSDAVLREFAGRNVALLRADWTRRDPAITAALAQLGAQRRAGLCAAGAGPAAGGVLGNPGRARIAHGAGGALTPAAPGPAAPGAARRSRRRATGCRLDGMRAARRRFRPAPLRHARIHPLHHLLRRGRARPHQQAVDDGRHQRVQHAVHRRRRLPARARTPDQHGDLPRGDLQALAGRRAVAIAAGGEHVLQHLAAQFGRHLLQELLAPGQQVAAHAAGVRRVGLVAQALDRHVRQQFDQITPAAVDGGRRDARPRRDLRDGERIAAVQRRQVAHGLVHGGLHAGAAPAGAQSGGGCRRRHGHPF